MAKAELNNAAKYSKEELLKNWSKFYTIPLSETEYSEISRNTMEFFKTLREWDKSGKV